MPLMARKIACAGFTSFLCDDVRKRAVVGKKFEFYESDRMYNCVCLKNCSSHRELLLSKAARLHFIWRRAF